MSIEKTRLGWLKGPMIGAMLVLIVAIAFGYMVFGSMGVALAYLRGQSVFVTPKSYDIGVCTDQELKVAKFRIHNLSRSDLVVTGANTNCTCVMPGEYPISIPPGKSREIEFQVRLSKAQPILSQLVTLYTDSADQHAIPLRITAQVESNRPR